MTFLRYFNILLIELFLIALPIGAQTVSPAETDSLTLVSDTIAADSISPNPEWYVAPEIPINLRAPRRAPAAASCPLDSILTFNIDSVLVEVTIYGYDNAGHTTKQEIWTCKADGSRVGKEKKEYGFTGSRQTMTAVYAWDATTNNWKGTEKSEYTYEGSKMTSNTSFVWLNAAWVADLRYTYSYDAAGRDATYYEYRRNTSTNQLEPYKGFVYVWLDDTQKSLEENYTTYSNGAWNGGTKKEWAFDAEGRQTLYSYYGTITNGQWVGSQKETWAYEGPSGQLTLHEQYGWYNNDWSMTLREKTGYDEAEHLILIENYSGANGVTTGVKKEEYTYDGDILTTTIKYAWSDGAWIGSQKETWVYGGPAGELTLHVQLGWASNDWSMTLKEETEYEGTHIVRIENYTYANGVPTGTKKEIWTFNNAGKQTLHEEFGWENNDWSKILKEETEYEGNNIVRIENYTYANGVTTGTKKEVTTYSNGKKTEFITYAWENGAWVDSNKEKWVFNTNKQQTLHEKYEWIDNAWLLMVQENTTYSGNTTIIENYERIAGVWTGTLKEETTVSNDKTTQLIVYNWENNEWVNSSKEEWSYNTSKLLTLHQKYEWIDNAWLIMGEENTTYSGSQVIAIENYERIEGVWTGTKKEEYTYSDSTKTKELIYQWYNNAWAYQTNEEWTYTSGRLTLHEKYGWNGIEWIPMEREIAEFDAAGNQTLVENYLLLINGWTGTKKEEYIFNDTNEKISITTYQWSEGGWVYSTRFEAGYQDGDAQVTEVNYTWNGNFWIPVNDKTATTYTEDKLSQVLTYAWDTINAQWINGALRVYIYDSKDRLIGDTTYHYVNSVWEYYALQTHGYDSHDNDTLAVTATWNGTEWVATFISKGTYTYTPSGNPLLIETYTGTSAKWTGDKKVVYTYDEAERMLTCWQYQWKNGKWVNKSLIEKRYDAAGHEIYNQAKNWQTNKWVGNYWYENEYDENGYQTKQVQYTWSAGDWYGLFRSDRGYDDQGHVLYSISFNWRKNTWVYRGKTEYIYDSHGNIVEMKVYSYEDDDWIGEQWNVYEYDDRDQEISNKEYYWISNEWVLSALYEKAYDESDNKLRRDVTGFWSNGVVTLYTDNHYFYSCDPFVIRFVNYDGTLLDSKTLDKGLTPSYSGETPTRPADAEYTYTFAGWTPNIVAVTSNATYTATFTSVKNKYTITWLNEDGSLIEETTMDYGVMPEHAAATKENTAEYTYTFAGWTPGLGIVTGDATYTATFDSIKNSYTVTWRNDDGTEIDQTSVQYGATPSHDDAVKDNTAEWTYTFAGWDPEVVSVVGDAIYTAKFDSVKNSYTITWRNWDLSSIDQTSVEYGVAPTHDDAIKDNTAEWTYTFAGWDPEVVSVVGDATYTAMFDSVKNSYTITWRNWDLSSIDQTTVEYGVAPTHDDAVKDNTSEWTYTFSGWDPEIVSVVGDATYTAMFDSVKNNYTITWRNSDNSLIDQTSVDYGTTPTHVDATREATAEWTYTFSGWDPDIVAVTGDAIYTASFDSTKNSYTISWLNWDNSLIDESTVDYGETPTHVDATREATAEWTYTFKAWEPEIVSVTGEATYTAKYDSTKNSYTISWLNWDNSLIDESTVDYGETPTHADATREATAEWTYTFKAWDPEIVSVTGNATYTAQFDSTKNSYTITWLNEDNSLIDETTVEYGVIPTHNNPTKDPTTEFIYTFAGWTPEVVAVTGNATYTATFTEHNNQFTITFLDVDGTTLQSSEVEYGETPVYEGVTPAKEATAEWTYSFAGWDPAIVDVVADATYTAKFDSTKNAYTITWRNWDDSLIDETSVDYGDTPTHVDATREATAEWTYTFTTWDPAVVAVTGEATYTAQFDSTKNAYTITWLNADGLEIEHETLEYGATPEHADIVKEATTEWTYSFLGWEPEITTVTGDANYKAIIDSTKNSYTVTWLNADGSEIEHETLEYGATPEHADIDKEATAEWTYTFAGWDPAIVDVVGDAFYKATFDSVKNTYTITWLNADGSEIEHETYEYGATPAHADIDKEATAEWTYTFTGWDPAIVDVVGDAFYKATFDSVKNTYTITWLNDDGTEIDHETLEYGSTPEHEDIDKEATAEWTYTFAGWDPAIVDVVGDAFYKATFDSVKNSYTITWLSNDGSEIDHASLEYGATPSHDDATKEATAEWTYTFTGWEPTIVEVVGDATYTAQFDSVKNSYTITWLNADGSVIDQETMEYGSTPTHADIDKENTAEWTYTFTGWDPEIVDVVGDATYTAQFDSVKNTYTITWLNWDNSLIDETNVEYGVEPTQDDPTKEATDEWTYNFTGWDPEVVAVIGDATYTAQFDSVKNTYTITWLNDDNSLIDQTTEEYGATPSHDDATKEATAEWTYTFTGWEPMIVDVVGDATYTAQFDSVKNSYTITWLNDDGSEIDHETLEYGATPAHADIDKENTAEYTYTFAGWDPEITMVTEDATYTAQFDSVKNSYTITWLNWDNSLIDESDVEYGVMPTHDDPTKETTAEWTYTFAGWDPEVVAVIGDATYTATFDSVKNTYTITWLNWDNSQLDQTSVEYGVVPTHDDPIKEATAEWTYTFAGWDPEVVAVIGDATYTAQFDSVKNSYTITWLNEDGTEIDHETLEYGTMPSHADIDKESTEDWAYTFIGWTPEITTVTGDATYTATFDSTQITIYYHVTITTDDATHGEAGFVYADEASSAWLTDSDVAEGTWIELRAKAAEDWHFDHWSDGDTASVRQVEVTADMQFTAYFALNCGDYPTLPVVSLYDWLLMLDVRSIHAMGYTFAEEDVIWYRVNGAPDKEADGAKADDERVGTGYSFTLNESLVNSGDYYATVDVSSSPAGTLCSGMMRSQIVHFASTRAAAPPMLTPALVRPNEPQHILRLDPESPTTITIYDLSGHLLRTFSEEGVDRMDLQAESVAGSYQVVVQNGDLRTVLRYIVVQ